LDRAYDNDRCRAEVRAAGYEPHVRRIGDEVPKEKNPDKPARR
jgi:hypothetical protein